MTQSSQRLPDDLEMVALRRCAQETSCDGGPPVVCGWMAFDRVTLLADIAGHSPTGAGESVEIPALACRSCGALQPDGIPPVILEQLVGLGVCRGNGD